jgi:hypothetical protein
MSEKAEQHPHQSHICARLRFKICPNASRRHQRKNFSLPKNLQSSQDRLKQAKERHRLKRAKERDQLERGSASNWEFLQALDEKECVLEIQAMILGKLAAEENKLRGLTGNCKIELNAEPFTGRLQDVVEALSTLKY